MHQGKHQEYEKRLHDTMQAQLGLTSANGGGGPAGGTTGPSLNGTTAGVGGGVIGSSNSTSGGVGNGNGSSSTGGNGTGTGTTTNGIIANGTGGSGKTGDSKHISDITNGPIQSKEAWPSLSTTPINGSTHGNGGGGSNKENKINGKTGVCACQVFFFVPFLSLSEVAEDNPYPRKSFLSSQTKILDR